MKFISIIKKYSLLLSILIFTILFIFSRIPFFLCPISGFTMDTFEYTRLLEQLLNGNMMDMRGIPGGYPFFLYIISPITTKVLYISIIQNIITYLIDVFLIYTIYKSYKYYSIFTSIAISLFAISHFVFKYDSMLMTESIYTNSIILIFIFFIWAIKTEKKIYWGLLSFSMILPIFIRPNGLFVYGVFFTLLVFLILKKYNKKIILTYLSVFLSLNLIWCFYNYISINIFSIGYPERIQLALGKENIKDSTNIINVERTLKNINKSMFPPARVEQNNPQIFKNKYLNTSYYYFKSFGNTQYHYGIITERYDLLFINDWQKMILMPGYTWFIASEDLKKLTFKEYYNTSDLEYLTDDYKKINENKLFKIHDYFYLKIYNPLFKNFIWIVISIIIFFVALYIYIKSKFTNTNTLIILFLFVIFFTNLLVILVSTGPGYSFERYCYPTDFIYYLSIALLPLLFNKKESSCN